MMSAPVQKRARIVVPATRQPPRGIVCRRSPLERLFHLDFGMLYVDLTAFLPREDVGTLSCVSKEVHGRLRQYGFRYKPRSRLVFSSIHDLCHGVVDSPTEGRLSLILSRPGVTNSEKVARFDMERGFGFTTVESGGKFIQWEEPNPNIMTYPCGKLGYFVQWCRSGDNGLRECETRLITSTDSGSTWVQQEVPILSDVTGFASVVLRDGSILVTGGTHISVFNHNFLLLTGQPNALVQPIHASLVFRGSGDGVVWEVLPAMEESLTSNDPVQSMRHHSMVVVDARPEDGALAQKYGVVIVVGGRHMKFINHVLYSYDGGMSWTQGPKLPQPVASFYRQYENFWLNRTYDYAHPVLVGVGGMLFMFGGTREHTIRCSWGDMYSHCAAQTKAREVWMSRDRGVTWELVCPLSHLDEDKHDGDFECVCSLDLVRHGVYKVIRGQSKLFLTFTCFLVLPLMTKTCMYELTL